VASQRVVRIVLAVLIASSLAKAAPGGQRRIDDVRAATAASTALGTDAELILGVRLVTNGYLTAREATELSEEVERIWRPYGVRVDWRVNAPWGGEHLVVVVVGGGSTTTLASLHALRRSHEHSAPSRGPKALIRVLFAPSWKLALESFRSDSYDVRIFRARRILPLLIGRVVAHELGHYLLQTREHTAAGLMKQSFSARDVLRTTREFRLDDAQIARLHALWTEREAFRMAAIRPEPGECAVPEP
jgi:hypothetical protein